MAQGEKKEVRDLEQDKARRAKRLIAIFQKCGITVVLLGQDDNPLIVMKRGEDYYKLCCYVKNFNLILLGDDIRDTTNVFATVKISHENAFDNRAEFVNTIREWLENSPIRPMSTINFTHDQSIGLCGWNFLNKKESLGRYPVFARHGKKVYLRQNDCQEIARELIDEGYSVVVNTPPLISGGLWN